MRDDRRLSWILLVIVMAAVAVSFLVTARFAFLNFFYLPVLLVAYWSGRRAATLVAVLCVLFVVFLYLVYPERFGLGGAGEPGSTAWMNLFVWGCILVLAGYASGTFIARVRERAEQQSSRPEPQRYNIGTLSIVKGYLRHDQVLKILQIQQRNHKPFGEIAVGLRLLTPDQLNELLQIQHERRPVTSSEIAMAKFEIAKAREASAREPR